jgi:hypothetical protein
LVAFVAACLLVHAALADPHFWRIHTVIEIGFGSLLLRAAVAGVCGVRRSSLSCKAGAIIGWWVGLSSFLLEHPRSLAAPLMGLAIFFLAGVAADVLADSELAPALVIEHSADERAATELAIRR